MAAGAMVVLNYFIHLSPVTDVSPLDPNEVCDVLLEMLDGTQHEQKIVEASLMIRNRTVVMGRSAVLQRGFIAALTKVSWYSCYCTSNET